MSGEQRWIIHVDLDAFFASVEELLNPDLRGKAIIVGGDPQQRGVVSSASYAARACGARSAMPVSRALRLCPQAVLVAPRHAEYARRSQAVMRILREVTPLVEQVSIDEAFLDVTGCEQLWGTAEQIARLIQRRIREEQHLPVSLGVATNKLVAKIACDLGKPSGLVIVPPGEERAFLAPLPLERLWGVGKATGAKLRALGIETIGQLADWPEEQLAQVFGKNGRALSLSARGVDHSRVTPLRERRSLSQEVTFARDVGDARTIREAVLRMSENVAARLREEHLVARTVRLKLRYPNFVTATRQATLAQPTDQGQVIYAQARQLLEENWRAGQLLRLIGVAASGLLESAGYQLDLFDRSDQRRIQLNEALDQIRARYGHRSITRASLLDKRHIKDDDTEGE